MSRVRSDKFTNRAATGPCTFTDGLCATDTTGVAIGVTLGYGGIVAVGATFGGDVSIGGTLTYEDVQNVDSTGLITARSGIKVGSPTGVGATFNPNGDLDIAGIATVNTTTLYSNGNVGLGTTNPVASSTAYDGATLHLGQPSSSAKGSQLKFTTGTSGHAATDGAYLAYYSDNHLYIYNRENEGMSFGTNATERLRIGAGGQTYFQGFPLIEKAKDFGATLSSRQDTGHSNLLEGNIFKYTGNETDSTCTVNFRGDGSTTLASLVNTGDNIATTIILYPNGTGLITVINIDGTAQTIEWSGGTAPTAGSSGVDIYSINLFRTGTGTTDWLVTASCTNYD